MINLHGKVALKLKFGSVSGSLLGFQSEPRNDWATPQRHQRSSALAVPVAPQAGLRDFRSSEPMRRCRFTRLVSRVPNVSPPGSKVDGWLWRLRLGTGIVHLPSALAQGGGLRTGAHVGRHLGARTLCRSTNRHFSNSAASQPALLPPLPLDITWMEKVLEYEERHKYENTEWKEYAQFNHFLEDTMQSVQENLPPQDPRRSGAMQLLTYSQNYPKMSEWQRKNTLNLLRSFMRGYEVPPSYTQQDPQQQQQQQPNERAQHGHHGEQQPNNFEQPQQHGHQNQYSQVEPTQSRPQDHQLPQYGATQQELNQLVQQQDDKYPDVAMYDPIRQEPEYKAQEQQGYDPPHQLQWQNASTPSLAQGQSQPPMGKSQQLQPQEQQRVPAKITRLVKPPLVIVFDIETTGLTPEKDRMIEIAAMDMSDTKKIFQTLVNPGMTAIPDKIVRLTGINKEMVGEESVPSFPEAARMLEQWVNERLSQFPGAPEVVMLAHNCRRFDSRFLEEEYRRCGRVLPGWKYLDSLPLTRKYLGQSADPPKSFSLGVLCEYFGITPGVHRAMSDVEALQKVYARLLEHIPPPRLAGIYQEETFKLLAPTVLNIPARVAVPPTYIAPEPRLPGRPKSSMPPVDADAGADFEGGLADDVSDDFHDSAVESDFEEEKDVSSKPNQADLGWYSSATAKNGGEEGDAAGADGDNHDDGYDDMVWNDPDPLSAVEARYADHVRHQDKPKHEGQDGAGDNLHTSSRWHKGIPLEEAGFRSASCRALRKEGFETLKQVFKHYPKAYNQYRAWGATEPQEHARFVADVTILDVAEPASMGRQGMFIRYKCQVGRTEEEKARHNAVLYFNEASFLMNARQNHRILSDKISKLDQPEKRLYGSIQRKLHPSRDADPSAPDEWEITEWSLCARPPNLDLSAPGYTEILPKYKQKGNLKAKLMPQVMQTALLAIEDLASRGELVDLVPEGVRADLSLTPYAEAVRHIHAPKGIMDIQRARDRLAFEELFIMQLDILLQRHMLVGVPDPKKQHVEGERVQDGLCLTRTTLVDQLKPRLYQGDLTPCQERALDEILVDMAGPQPMLRLLQGDVGSGKTAVAFLALIAAVDSKWQGAMIAPTEVLATQHYENFKGWLEDAHLAGDDIPQVALLTGSTPQNDKDNIKARLREGKINIIVGTHALLENRVEFSRLGLAVVDEQHRFGVVQRSEHSSQFTSCHTSARPHMLAMTATPIPRTLAMIEEGIFALSAIEKSPPGRKPVITTVCTGNRRDEVYARVAEQLALNAQVFVVCPQVERSDVESRADVASLADVHPELTKRFPEYASFIGVLHGKQKPDEKQATMDNFKAGRLRVLVSTSVIEVGVDVPAATVMVIESAEKFGLAQLHQFRGRVGRGRDQSYCYLITSNDDMGRIGIMAESNNGFTIAERDLRIRGPGEVLGTAQSGHTYRGLKLANVINDREMLEEARLAAAELVAVNNGEITGDLMDAILEWRVQSNQLRGS